VSSPGVEESKVVLSNSWGTTLPIVAFIVAEHKIVTIEIMNNTVPNMIQNALTGKMTVKEATDDAAEKIKTLIAQRKS